ncbi:MAG: exonuclease domain-containing protein [Bacteroidota bacterium]
MSRYAVLDIETTGLSPAYNHRILEVAVVLADDDGDSVHAWDTLINPVRDVGATEIHGLTAADVYSAPTFEQIAPELVSLLKGRVLVAHNLSFDAPFLAAEFARAGYVVRLERTLGLCTMRLASHYLPASPRTLEGCCNCIGYRIDSAHAAVEDARATARLLAYYIRQDDNFLEHWADAIAAAQRIAWPAMPSVTVTRVSRKSAAAATKEHFLWRLASRVPRCEIHPEANSYLAVLDRVLLDRQISRHEADELVAVAGTMGLSREDVLTIHRLYLAALARLAQSDGAVTPDERTDLMSVAALLGLPGDSVDCALDSAAQQECGVVGIGRFALEPGDTVVFTGEAPGMARADLEYQARVLGLCVTGSVSSNTTLVVAADPDSLSGKARKARSLGIPIVDYATYLRMLESLRCWRST